MMEARACAWLVVLGLESAALSLGPAKKDEESAKSPGPLSSGAYPLVGGSHEADASTADSGGQSVRLYKLLLVHPDAQLSSSDQLMIPSGLLS